MNTSILVALSAAIVSVALSIYGAATLPANAHLPIHWGFTGADGFLRKTPALVAWPALVAFAAGVVTWARAPAVVVGAIGGLLVGLNALAIRSGLRQPHRNMAARKTKPWAVALFVLVLLLAAIPLSLATWARPSGAPASVRIVESAAIVEIRGGYRLLSFKGRVEVPLETIAGVGVVDPWTLSYGRRVGGTAGGDVLAGRFTRGRCETFLAVVKGQQAVVFELEGHDFDRIVVGVEDPVAVVSAVQSANPGVRQSAGLCITGLSKAP